MVTTFFNVVFGFLGSGAGDLSPWYVLFRSSQETLCVPTLYYFVPLCNTLCHFVLICATLYYFVPFSSTLRHFVLPCASLCRHFVLLCVTLYSLSVFILSPPCRPQFETHKCDPLLLLKLKDMLLLKTTAISKYW